MPAEFLAYVRSTPLDVRVTAVEQVAEVGPAEYPRCEYRVNFSVPDGEHVPNGLEVSVKYPERVSEDFKVVASSANEISAEGTFSGNCLASEGRPSLDWVLTSGAYPASKF